jgi:hypothetical protein
MSITGLAHINLIIPAGSLDLANEFYGKTLGLTPREVPSAQKGTLAWFDIADSGQQVHIAFGPEEVESRRHPCFSVSSGKALLGLQTKIFEHFQKGGQSAPRQCDQPGTQNSGAQGTAKAVICGSLADSQGVEYPQRFFARDYAG